MRSKEQILSMKSKIIGRLNSIQRNGITELVNYLINDTDYFTAPASSNHHSNCAGGLAFHSDCVVENMLAQKKLYDLNISDEAIYLIGYCHDLCKCNTYTQGYKLAKNPSNDSWAAVPTWIYKDILALGHGEKSLYLLSKFITLTDEEAYLIRWHMGAWVGENQWKCLDSARKQCPLLVIFNYCDDKASLFDESTDAQNYLPVKIYNDWVKNKELKEKM